MVTIAILAGLPKRLYHFAPSHLWHRECVLHGHRRCCRPFEKSVVVKAINPLVFLFRQGPVPLPRYQIESISITDRPVVYSHQKSIQWLQHFIRQCASPKRVVQNNVAVVPGQKAIYRGHIALVRGAGVPVPRTTTRPVKYAPVGVVHATWEATHAVFVVFVFQFS